MRRGFLLGVARDRKGGSRAHRAEPGTGSARGAAPGQEVPQRFLAGLGWEGAAKVLQSVLRLALIAVLTRYLGTERYGLWAIFLSTVEILIPIAPLGMRYGYTRSRAGLGRTREAAAAFYAAGAVALASSLVVAGLWWASAGPFAGEFMRGDAEGRQMVEVGALILVFGTAELMLREYFATFLQMRARGVIIVLRVCLDMAAAGLVVWGDWGPVGLAACMTASRFLPTLLGAVLVFRRFGLLRPDWSVVGPYVRFGLPLQVAGAISVVLRLADRHVLGTLRSKAEVGVFSACGDLGLVLLPVVLTIQPVLLPALSALYNHGEKDRALWLYGRMLLYFLLVSVPSVAFLAVAPESVARVLTTPEFARDGAAVVPLVAAGTALFGVCAMARNLLALVHRTGLAMLLWVTAAGAKIGLTFLFVHWWGLVGAAVATVVAGVGLTLASWVVTRRDLPWGVSLWAMGKTVLASAAAALPAWALAGPGVVRLAASAAAFGVVFVGLMFGLRVVRMAEFRSLLAALRKRGEAAAEDVQASEG